MVKTIAIRDEGEDMFEAVTIAGLVLGFPAGLFAFVIGLERFESTFVQPNERAAAVAGLVVSDREADEVEAQAAKILAPAVPGPEVEREPVRT